MQATIHLCTGRITRSVLRAVQVASLELNEEPDDTVRFAELYGGDFIEIDDTQDE